MFPNKGLPKARRGKATFWKWVGRCGGSLSCGGARPWVREEDRRLPRTPRHSQPLGGGHCVLPVGARGHVPSVWFEFCDPRMPGERLVNETIRWFANGTRGWYLVCMFMSSESQFVTVTSRPWPAPWPWSRVFPSGGIPSGRRSGGPVRVWRRLPSDAATGWWGPCGTGRLPQRPGATEQL